jgi:uncharacterized protein YxjI
MALYLKNKFASISGSSSVTDEAGNVKYTIKGKVFSFTRKKFIVNENGETLYIVRNKWFRFFHYSSFVLDQNEEIIMKITKNVFTHHYKTEGYTSNISIDGNFIGWDFDVKRDGEVIGIVNREFTVLIDSFKIEAYKKEDEPLIIALVVALDNIADDAQND